MNKLIKPESLTSGTVMISTAEQTNQTYLAWSDYLELEETTLSKQPVLLEPDVDIDEIYQRLKPLSLIALNFPSFYEGRPYSTAAILRQRYHYQADIRAVGAVRVDQLNQMYRCGFSSFEISNDQLTDTRTAALQFFSSCQQNDSSDAPTLANNNQQLWSKAWAEPNSMIRI
ncbi:MAG: DUF934 domain-containing protein [Gammaproteobacteria bacterium]|jgi:uncharacterized protein (DUF934 family)|nr:DUF934 domain-containing protein [Gammaproteobacteria bacterium]MBT5203702.1 DUF934 domain-containing protein [Gammaproteobacteria bacterium]MBT5601693.1 DUF934 domain-containing protein [Gammaproteobacteria bacterium]